MFLTVSLLLRYLPCLLLAACSNGGGGGDDCQKPAPPEPAFRLELTAEDGPLPAGTRVDVMYQGNLKEGFVLGKSSVNEDVCCRPGAKVTGSLPRVACGHADAGTARPEAGSGSHADAGQGAPDAAASHGDSGMDMSGSSPAVLCDLWTNGAAEVRVLAPGYPLMDQVLDAKLRSDGCGVETVETRLMLKRADAGE